MQYDSNTPRVTRTIAGISLSVIAPFAEGQPLTEATAAMLNQTLAENFSNNVRKKLEAGIVDADGNKTGDHTAETAQAVLDSYMTAYEPGVRQSGGGEPRVTDPVEKEARALARGKAKELVLAKGLKTKDVDMPTISNGIFEKFREQLMAAASKIVAARQKQEAGTDLDLGDIEIAAKPEAAPAAA